MSRKYRDVRNGGWSGGVIAPEGHSDPQLFRDGLSIGLNAFITALGSLIRRPGSFLTRRHITTAYPPVETSGDRKSVRLETFDMSDGLVRHAEFTAGGVSFFEADGTLETTLAGPWTDDEVHTMAIVFDLNKIYVVSQSFFPRTLTLDVAAGSWSIANFAFREDPNGRLAAPFERFAADAIEIEASAYTGDGITVTFSDDVLDADYVGVRFVIAFGAQVEITAVTDAQTATADVKGIIYPTQTVTVADTAVYTVGDIVSGDTSGVRGQVVAKTGVEITVVNISGYDLFQPETIINEGEADEETIEGESIAGPGGSEKAVTVTQSATPSATNIWFEEIISTARGYPATACLHRNRLIFAGFPELPSFIAASASGAVNDFDIRDGEPDDAIVDGIGGNTNEKIIHLASLEQLILLTDERCLYVSEGNSQGFIPGGISFDNIGPEITSPYPPTISSEGLLFLDRRDRVILLSITGSVRGTWQPLELTRLAYHLFSNPISLRFSAGVGGRPERVLTALNADGSLVVFSYPRGAERGGWVLWEREGGWHSVSSHKAEMFCLGGPDADLERIDFEAVLDGQFELGAEPDLAGDTFHILQSDIVTGETTLDDDGLPPVSDGFDSETMLLGRDFNMQISPIPYTNENIGRIRQRIYQVYTDVLMTGVYRVEGRLHRPDYAAGTIGLPAIVTRIDKTNTLGSSEHREILIEQRAGEGGPFHLRAVTFKVRGS